MKCVNESLKARITDVLVGEAEPSVSEQVLAHLETCASCREDRDQMATVLGLLKESPPWAAKGSDGSASAEEDSLSTIQRQKIGSLAAPRAAKKASLLPMSWLGLAASLSAVGLALVLARKSAVNQIEAPTPVPAASSVHQLPQAIEGPILPTPSGTVESASVTSKAATRSEEVPSGVKVAPEAMREFKRQAMEDETGKLDQLALAQEVERSRKEKGKDEGDRVRGEDGGGAGGVAGGVAGGIVGDQRPEASAAMPAVRVGGNVQPPPAAPTPITARTNAPTQASRGGNRQSPSGFAAGLSEAGNELQEQRSSGYVLDRSRTDSPTRPTSPRDMFFESKGTNPFIVTEEDPQATFGLDVDTASYTLTRNYLNRGALPPAAAVRVEEFVNAFPNGIVADRGQESQSVFAVRVDGAPNPLHPGYHVLRVAMKAKDVDSRARKAAHLTFVIDVSGSMAQENRLGLVKRSLALLVDKLDERDTIGIVVYGTSGRRVLAPTSAVNRERIQEAIDRLHPEGSTNLQDGLDLGYEMAVESFRRGASNRVVLCTDGVANTGQTEADALLARIRSEAGRGIDMMALGFGMGNYNDALLQRLADEGNGQYAYIDDLGEARAFFLRRLTSVLEVVARDAKAQVEFNPARVERYRLLGYEKRDVADRDFRNDAVDAGEINAGHSVTALFEVKLKGGPGAGKIGTARIRYQTGPQTEGVEFAREIVDEALTRVFDQASPAFRTAYVAARFAEHLRKSYWVKNDQLAALQSLADSLPEAAQTSELADLIRKAVRLNRQEGREDW